MGSKGGGYLAFQATGRHILVITTWSGHTGVFGVDAGVFVGHDVSLVVWAQGLR